MAGQTPITVAYGDGIGPEIMEATLLILQEAGARIKPEVIEIGEKVYLAGNSAGIDPSAWDALRRTKVFLKAPITTPQGGGYKSLNVTTRKTLGLYANVRPCVSYHPFVETKHPVMDVVIVRENEEDLYAGIEYQQTDEVMQSLKLITRPGSEKIVRYAFEYAIQNGRKKVTCFTKDNIMKMSDGLFHKVFDEIGADYPDIEKEHWIVDIGAAKLADTPEAFDVVVMPNLYGDILSDVAARIHNAWLRTLEDGVHTYDVFDDRVSKEKVGTKEFAQAVVKRLGKEPVTLKKVKYQGARKAMNLKEQAARKPARKELVGVDVFVQANDRDPQKLGQKMEQVAGSDLKLAMISNRGVVVYPSGHPETFCTDHWRCRFFSKTEWALVSHQQIVSLLGRFADAGVDFIKTEHLINFDGKRAYSLD